jgi:hypothetical protein
MLVCLSLTRIPRLGFNHRTDRGFVVLDRDDARGEGYRRGAGIRARAVCPLEAPRVSRARPMSSLKTSSEAAQ